MQNTKVRCGGLPLRAARTLHKSPLQLHMSCHRVKDQGNKIKTRHHKPLEAGEHAAINFDVQRRALQAPAHAGDRRAYSLARELTAIPESKQE